MSTYETVAVTPGEAKISDLAASARKSEKEEPLWKRFSIPLMLLAPALILGALVAVVLPVSVVLIRSSQDVTNDLSQTYFASMMASTQGKIYHSLDAQRYALLAFGPLASTAVAMSHRYNILGETAMWKQMMHLTAKYGLDACQCYTATWAPGVSKTPPGTWSTTNVTWLQTGHRYIPPFSNFAVSIEDLSSNGNGMQYDLDQTTFDLVNATFAIYNATGAEPFNMTTYAINGNLWPIIAIEGYDLSYAPTLQELLVPNPRREIFYTLATTPEGLHVTAVSQVYQSADPDLLFSCGAGITIDSTWSHLLMDAAGANTGNKILLLDSTDTLPLVSTSNRNISYGQALTKVKFNETLSASLRAAVVAKYGKYSSMLSDPDFGKSFEAQVEGDTWIIVLGRVQLTAYASNTLVVVLAVPRASIFSRIDSAQKKSLGLAIGLSVGIGMLMALLFALIVTPLRRLAHAMGLLTNLDFASLNKGNILDQKSAITEIRNVQRTFSTMVKAFAGGIKQNRDLQTQQSKQGGGSSQTASRGTTGSGPSTNLLPTGAGAAKRATREYV
ncbi:hypothetical protein HDU88_005879 [Geranomyces variabilis]|nr:hypothetical protein HDU88_005879 [Geranomyces variabilis]